MPESRLTSSDSDSTEKRSMGLLGGCGEGDVRGLNGLELVFAVENGKGDLSAAGEFVGELLRLLLPLPLTARVRGGNPSSNCS